jgi:hypothetical protein
MTPAVPMEERAPLRHRRVFCDVWRNCRECAALAVDVFRQSIHGRFLRLHVGRWDYVPANNH